MPKLEVRNGMEARERAWLIGIAGVWEGSNQQPPDLLLVQPHGDLGRGQQVASSDAMQRPPPPQRGEDVQVYWCATCLPPLQLNVLQLRVLSPATWSLARPHEALFDNFFKLPSRPTVRKSASTAARSAQDGPLRPPATGPFTATTSQSASRPATCRSFTYHCHFFLGLLAPALLCPLLQSGGGG